MNEIIENVNRTADLFSLNVFVYYSSTIFTKSTHGLVLESVPWLELRYNCNQPKHEKSH